MNVSEADANAALREALELAVTAPGPERFVDLLAEDVCWGSESGGNVCANRVQAASHYQGLLAAGLRLRLVHLQEVGPPQAPLGTQRFVAGFEVQAPDQDARQGHTTVRLTVRQGRIADIREMSWPPLIEVLYFDGCPHHERLLPHLRTLLAAHDIDAPVHLVRVDNEADAARLRFLGSPSVRVDGHDVDPTLGGLESADYSLRCRLYLTPDGSQGTPHDQWLADALFGNVVHDEAAAAVRAGRCAVLARMMGEHPDLARQRLSRHGGRTLLHVATDWPGHFPSVAESIRTLVAAGADPNVPVTGHDHAETPLHWAASTGDLDAINALLDAGADINVPGAVIGGGTPMADATAFAQWAAARLLLDRGAATTLFEAAALGLDDRVRAILARDSTGADDIASAFWGACHGGSRTTAEVLLGRGAVINWVGHDGLTPLDAALRARATDLADWLRAQGASTAANVT